VGPHELVRQVVSCWSDRAGLDRMKACLSPGYVHHTPFGDLDFAGFRAGMAWVDTQFAARSYEVERVVVEGDLASGYLAWRATRVADGSPVEGRGAYFCRIEAGLIAEDWDVFALNGEV